jgi:plasmid stabilization system protein ParE
MFVNWTPKARNRLQFYYEQIWGDSPTAADFVMDSIIAAASMIPAHPYIYREGRKPNTREMVVLPNYIVVYRIRPTQIDILNVIHSRKRYP